MALFDTITDPIQHTDQSVAYRSVGPGEIVLGPDWVPDGLARNPEVEVIEKPKKRALFIPASIRSHIIPTLYLADLMAHEYDIYYAVTNQVLADIVSENGFTPVMNDQFRIGVGMEPSFLQAKKKKAGFWQVIQSICANELFKHRKQQLDRLMDEIKPEVVFIDVFNSTDFLALYHYRSSVQLLFCNPMLSTYRVGNLPIVSEGEWLETPAAANKPNTFNVSLWGKIPRL